jgi:NitT/TauT family transport system ATP-binding protein
MLIIKNLFVQYRDSRNPAIQDVSFAVEKGERIAILGPSGCGKSTTLNAIAGLLAKEDVTIGGQIIWDKENEKPTIRTVFQEATLLPWRTVEKNIALGLEVEKFSKEKIQKKVFDALKMIGLVDFAKSYPHQLSIGMKQRVNFARALVCDPDLLLLDEPFSALDIKTKKRLQDDFLKILREKKITSIFVTHNIEEATAMSTRIIVFTESPALVLKIINGNPSNIFLDEKTQNFIENLELHD